MNFWKSLSVNRIVSYFEKKFVSIETVNSISTNLGVQIDSYEWPELPSGKRLLYLEDRIAYWWVIKEGYS